MLVFGDNSEMCSHRSVNEHEHVQVQDTNLFGMYAISRASWQRLRAMTRSVKVDLLGEGDVPVKWNMKDLRRDVEPEVYEKLIANSEDVRTRMLEAFVACEPVIVAATEACYSLDPMKVKTHRHRVQLYCFANALERIAHHVRSLHRRPESVSVVLDWPDKERRADFDTSYRNALLNGTIEYGGASVKMNVGKLIDLGFEESPRYSVDKLDLGVQCADLALGLLRDVWSTSLRGETVPEWKGRLLRKLSPCFRRNGDGLLNGIGLVIRPKGRFHDDSLRALRPYLARPVLTVPGAQAVRGRVLRRGEAKQAS